MKKFQGVQTFVPYFKILLDANTLLANTSSDNAFQKRCSYNIEFHTLFVREGTQLYKSVCDWLDITKMEHGIKYEVEDGCVNGQYCKYVMLQGQVPKWNEEHAMALIHMIEPYLHELANGAQLIELLPK